MRASLQMPFGTRMIVPCKGDSPPPFDAEQSHNKSLGHVRFHD